MSRIGPVRRPLRVVVVVVVLFAVVALFALPVRTLLGQRRSLSASEHRLQVLSREDSALTSQARHLQDTATIEQIAREQYGLTMPGTQAYVILPPQVGSSTSTTTVAGPKR